MMLRYSYPPHPVGFVPREILRAYLDGDDPVTYKPLMQEMIDALTNPLTEEELHPVIEKKPRRPRLLAPDSETNLHRLFLEKGWTDGLPIVLPTEERVAEMLTGTDHDPQEVVGQMSVTTHEERLEYTVEKVAVNAVMAGCRPEHFPVVLALAASQIPSLPSSTTSFGSMMVVNGPIRQKIGMNCETGALSPFNFANAVIGRAWTLLSLNFGDAKINENFTASIGNNFNYNNMCCAENEELSVFEPYHVSKGFKASESAVSLFRGWSIQGFGLGPARRMAEVLKARTGMMAGGATFVIDPLVAKSLKNEGFKNRTEVGQYFVNELKNAWLKPESFNLIVVGGEWNPMWLTTDFFHNATVSIDKWIPKKGVTLDVKPLRMPAPAVCRDGICGLPGNSSI